MRILQQIELKCNIYHLQEDEKEWFAREFELIQLEYKISPEEKKDLIHELIKSEVFDNFLATKFATVKRYGGEGAESMIGFFLEIFRQSCIVGLKDIVIGVPHRGRLNLLTGLLNFPPVLMFKKMLGFPEFPSDINATGDVLSHLTGLTEYKFNSSSVCVTLLPNPSHLEAISPVVVGYARSRLQTLKLADYETYSQKEVNYPVLPIQVHGDASFAGQGVVMETLAMSNVPHYSVGGSIHLIVNNQIGFTTPQERGSDASKFAYSTVAFLQVDTGSAVHIQLVQSKVRIAPCGKKETTIASRNVRVVAWILRFIHNISNVNKLRGNLVYEEFKKAENLVFKSMQLRSFQDEKFLAKMQAFKDEEGLLRIRTKLVDSDEKEDF
ncbi:probable 2-oxoglutarate dehydrogenase E1 component DHKTD1, mitochondrial [Nephila pilipes]|uniref:Probable 2-oxoglutarate dehydrogenase E1 component DHKTD1, mitochondrial n=1 Tax=Nephila pilipes TaxID=299642 RepID=A0A8X6N066_NEPPI|nr:probable 2-oxoglutarate dehydrogenase E1 component DHKTD1, mitochondrial [Nephila pilipes]